MGLFGAIASVANGFQLVPTGTQSGSDAASAPTGTDAAAAPALLAAQAQAPLAPLTPLSGPLRAQANEIAARASGASVRGGYLGELGALFAPAEGSPGLGASYEAFAQSWRGLAANPRDPALAQTVIQRGDTLAGSVRTLAGGVETLATRIGGDVTAGLQDLNQTLVDIHHENRTIATQAALDQPSDDDEAKRDALVAKVVDMTGANVFPRENRGVALYTASGQVLLDGRPSQFTSTAATGPVPINAVSADGKITDGRLGALLRLAADGSKATPPRAPDPAPDAEIVRKLRSQLDAVAGTALARTKPKQPTSLSDAYDMAIPGNSSELGFGFFVGTGRHDLQVNPDLLSGAKTLKTDAATAVTASLGAGGRQLAADGLNLSNASYGQFAGLVANIWGGLGAGADRDAKIATTANTLMTGYRQSGGTIDVQSEVTALTTVQDALGTTRRIGHALGDFLRSLEQVAA